MHVKFICYPVLDRCLSQHLSRAGISRKLVCLFVFSDTYSLRVNESSYHQLKTTMNLRADCLNRIHSINTNKTLLEDAQNERMRFGVLLLCVLCAHGAAAGIDAQVHEFLKRLELVEYTASSVYSHAR